MLNEHGVAFRYREYRKEPLNREELTSLLQKLDLTAGEVLRVRDRANQELGLTGDEPQEKLINAMAEHPTLLQRPIGVTAQSAVLGRPVERLLTL